MGDLVKHTGQSMETIRKDTDRDFYMDSGAAREYGIIDEVMEPKKGK